MAKHGVVILCVLLAVIAMSVPRPASAADRYEVVVEYNGPHFHVMNAPDINQLVDDPLHETQFLNPYGVAVSLEAGGRLMNYVMDSGNKRILGFESQIDVTHFNETGATWAGGGASAASEFDDNQIYLPEWVAVSTKWMIPYSEIVEIDGTEWKWVASVTGFTAADQVYTIDFDDASNAPEIVFPASSLSATSTFEVTYAATNYQGGGTAAFGVGDVDQDNSDGAALVAIVIDEAAPTATSIEDQRAIFTIANQTTATTDEIWLIDAADNSSGADEYLRVYTVTQATGVEAALESYDDLLWQPSDIYVAKTTADTYTAPTYTGEGTWTTAAASVDANQVTGPSYSIDMTGSNVTITDLTTGRVLVSNGAKTDFETTGNTCFVLPGIGLDWDVAVADDSDGTITTTRAISSRYGFVCDRGNDRVKVIQVPDISTSTGDDLPGDAHTCDDQPVGANTIGATADEDYSFTTPATVPENWQTGTAARPVKELSITVVEDPDGIPVTWVRVDDLGVAGPSDKVYQFDWWEGTILFGDGLHGALPTAATEFNVTYTSTPDVLRYGSEGGGAGQFSGPSGVCAMWSANLGAFVVYVADTGNDRIQKFLFYPEDLLVNTPPRMEYVCAWNTAADASDFLAGPVDIDVETDGTYYFVGVADHANDRVIIYKDIDFNLPSSTVPAYETAIGGTGNTLGSFYSISAIDMVKNGTEIEIYVADDARGTITKYVKAPSPTIVLTFTGTSALPNSFPPSSSYVIAYTATNAPAGGWVDFYYDTAGTFSTTSASLCFAEGTYGPSDSPVTWVFADSPGGVPADGVYYLYAILRDSEGNQVATDQATSSELLTIDRDLTPSVQARDHFDGDPTQLLAPNEVQTVLLELTYPDSVIGCSFIGTFPAAMMEINGIYPGNGWEGTEYTNHVWNATYDNTAGTFSVFSAVTGVPDGLTGSSRYIMARVNVQAKDVLTTETRTMSGTFDLDETASSIQDSGGDELEAWSARDLAVKLAYVGDIAHSTAGTDSTVPYQQPNPDGYINFADQMALTLGWNGDPTTFMRDPIADMGPVTGTAPALLPARDGNWDVDDLLAFTGNWSWFSANGYVTPSLAGGNPGVAFTPLGEPVDGATAISLEADMDEPLPGHNVTVDVRVDDAEMLTGAMVRVAYDPAELSLVSVDKGDLLGRGGANVMLNTIRREGVCELSMTRFHMEKPGVSGDGVLASLTFRIVSPPESGLSFGYDLRDFRNDVLARGTSELGTFGEGRLASVVLCQNYPNPLNPSTSIVFTLPTKQAVDLAVYDLSGRRVRTLVNGPQAPGVHTIEWDGLDQAGAQVASGVYFYKLRAGDFTQTRKLVVTR